jgi:hypothetical protein
MVMKSICTRAKYFSIILAISLFGSICEFDFLIFLVFGENMPLMGDCISS